MVREDRKTHQLGAVYTEIAWRFLKEDQTDLNHLYSSCKIVIILI